MAIKMYKPTSPGRRGMSVSTFEEITRTTPERSLLRPVHAEQCGPQQPGPGHGAPSGRRSQAACTA